MTLMLGEIPEHLKDDYCCACGSSKEGFGDDYGYGFGTGYGDGDGDGSGYDSFIKEHSQCL